MDYTNIPSQINLNTVLTTLNKDDYTVSHAEFSDFISTTLPGGLAIYSTTQNINLNVQFSTFSNMKCTKQYSEGSAIRIESGEKINVKCITYFQNACHFAHSMWFSQSNYDNLDKTTVSHISSSFCYAISTGSSHLDGFSAKKLPLTNLNYTHSQSKNYGMLIYNPPTGNIIKFMNYYNQSGSFSYFYFYKTISPNNNEYINFVDNDITKFVYHQSSDNNPTVNFYHCNLIFTDPKSKTVPSFNYCHFSDVYTHNIAIPSDSVSSTVIYSNYIELQEHKCSLRACTNYHPQYNNDKIITQHFTIVYICSLSITK